MAQNEVQEMLEMFADGNGFGDPEARRNAEFVCKPLWPSNKVKLLRVSTT